MFSCLLLFPFFVSLCMGKKKNCHSPLSKSKGLCCPQHYSHGQFVSFLCNHNRDFLWHVTVISSCTSNGLQETQFNPSLSLSGLSEGADGLGLELCFVTSVPYTHLMSWPSEQWLVLHCNDGSSSCAGLTLC